MSSVNSAIQAYKNASGLKGPAGGGAEPAGTAFTEFLSENLDKAINAGYKGEKASLGSIAKTTSPVDVVTAVTNVELTLQTVVAVRDKVIAAYQDILKMPI